MHRGFVARAIFDSDMELQLQLMGRAVISVSNQLFTVCDCSSSDMELQLEYFRNCCLFADMFSLGFGSVH